MIGNAPKQLSDRSLVNLMAIHKPPSDPQERFLYGIAVSDRLSEVFKEELPTADRRAFVAGPLTVKVLDQFDEFIIRTAMHYGWRVLMSRTVEARIAKWYEVSERGPELLERLGKALAQGARVIRGQDKLPITETGWYTNKQNAVKELRLVFRQYRNTFNQRRNAPSHQEVCEWFQRTIGNAAGAFIFLGVNVESLIRYFDYAKDHDQVRARRITLGIVGPAELFDAWGAWSTNLSENTFRQAISAIGSSKL